MSSSRYVRSTPGPTAVRGKSANNLNELTRALLTPVPTATITPFVSGTFQEYINYYYGSASSGQAAPAATSRPSTSSTTYIGNKNTHVFHYASCSSVSQMKSSNKVYIDSRQDAIDSSYRPCQRCHP
ncbi:MAG: hypothetical protein IKS52_04685 [Clostridia bacterium]|nr:hypothetical protein [Clostridia bacterium]